MKKRFVSRFDLAFPPLSWKARLALLTGAKLVVRCEATSLRDPVKLDVSAAAGTSRNGAPPKQEKAP